MHFSQGCHLDECLVHALNEVSKGTHASNTQFRKSGFRSDSNQIRTCIRISLIGMLPKAPHWLSPTLTVPRNNQSLKGAVVVVLCQNEAEVKCQMDIYQHISLREKAGAMRLIVLRMKSGGNLHWKLYFCLILAEGRANCSFQYLREARTDPQLWTFRLPLTWKIDINLQLIKETHLCK